MIYDYESKYNNYYFLSKGIEAWILLLPNNIGLRKNDTVRIWEVDKYGDRTGNVTDSTIVFNGVEGMVLLEGNQDFFYINNLISYNMFGTYRAILNQSGISEPVVTVLENTTGITFTWNRVSTGVYQCVPSADITGFTIETYAGTSLNNNVFINFNGIYDDSNLVVQCYDVEGNGVDSVLSNTAVFARFYQ